jgi:type III secretion protein T
MNDFLTHITQYVIGVALCLPRMLAAFTVVPFLNPGYITGVTRNSIALSFSLILFPSIYPLVLDGNISAIVLLAIIAKETVIGLSLGYIVGLFFWGVQAVGKLIDYQRGASVAESFDPSFGGGMSPLGSLLMPLAMLLFFVSGGFLMFLTALYESYQAWPIISLLPIPNPNAAIVILERIDDYMEMILLLASPLLIVMVLTDIGMGLINRFAPQLNVFFLSMPIKSVLAIFCIICYFPFLVAHLNKYIAQHADVFNLLKSIIQ